MHFEHRYTPPHSSHYHLFFSLPSFPIQHSVFLVFFTELSPVCVGQLILGVGPAVACEQPPEVMSLKETDSCSPNSYQMPTAPQWLMGVPFPPSYLCACLCSLSLVRACVCCRNHGEFIHATALLGVDNSASWCYQPPLCLPSFCPLFCGDPWALRWGMWYVRPI